MCSLQRMFVLLNLVGLSVLAFAGAGQAKSFDATLQTEIQTQANSDVALTPAHALAPRSPQVAVPLLAQTDGSTPEMPMIEAPSDSATEPSEIPTGATMEAPLETLPAPSQTSQILLSPLDPETATYDNSTLEITYPASPDLGAQTPDLSMGQSYPGSTIYGLMQQSYPNSTMDDSTIDSSTMDESSSPQLESQSVDDPADDTEAQTDPLNPDTSEISPGRTTRSGPSYIGVGGNIGLGDGDTALGEGSFSLFSKIGLTRNISVRPAVLFSDDPTILMPITLDFIPLVTDVTEDVSSNLGIRVSPYVGVGAAISTGGDGALDFLATGGVDVGLSERFTGVVSVNASLFDNIAIGLMLGVGYNF